MKLRYRRLIYLSFIAAFLIITPIIITYTAGYRYNFKKGVFEKTGIIYLDSRPGAAQIYIGGKLLGQTPARFTELLPETYKVEVKKDGYYPWQKNVEVKSNLTTFDKDIVLFKQSLPVNVVTGQINALTSSANQQKIIYSVATATREEIRILNFNNDSSFLIKTLDRKSYTRLDFISWSVSQNQALFKETLRSGNKFFIINLDNLTATDLSAIAALNFDEVKWDAASDNFLYGLAKKNIYQIDLSKATYANILTDSIQTFTVAGDDIYYISNEKNDLYLYHQNLNAGNNILPEKIKIPNASYQLQIFQRSDVILTDMGSNNIYIISTNIFSDQVKSKIQIDIANYLILQDKAKKIIWSSNSQIMLYFNDYEIWTFDFLTQQKNLITRYGSIINRAIWYPADKYIIYQVKGAIHAIENTSEDIKNDITLANLAADNNLILDSAGNNLYFAAKIGNQEGLFKLQLQ